jgi:hypothetical protein
MIEHRLAEILVHRVGELEQVGPSVDRHGELLARQV